MCSSATFQLLLVTLGVISSNAQVFSRSLKQAGAPFNLISPELDRTVSSLWRDIQDDLFNGLDSGSEDESQACGDAARVWWRVFFHDFGTFDINRGTGGVDGSIQFELNRPENREATGIPATITVYQNLQQKFRRRGTVTMADIVTLAAQVAVAACGGPPIGFTPGRRDATSANGAGLLPGEQDSAGSVLAKMTRMGLPIGNATAMLGAGHTIARKGKVTPLDSTDSFFDNLYFKQMVARAAPGFIRADLNLRDGNANVLQWMRHFASDQDSFFQVVAWTTEWMSWTAVERAQQ